MPITIPRFVINFRHKCNMNCKYCYVPFVDQEYGDIFLWKKIIDAIQDYNPSLITFGGGDPFIYPDFRELLLYCKNSFFDHVQIHVDTNGLGIIENDYNIIDDCVNVIGFPLDGSKEIHSLIRNNLFHYNIVMRHLSMLQKSKSKSKINTVLNYLNIYDIQNLISVINEYKVAVWYLYEYWHFAGINQDEPLPNKVDIDKQIKLIKKQVGDKFIYSNVESRKDNYVFVSSIGCVYTIVNKNEYIEIGSIFEENIHLKIDMYINDIEIQKRTFEKLILQ